MKRLADLSRDGRWSRSRRRGAALVLVLVFGLGALMLVSTLLAISDASTKAEYGRHRTQTLHQVLKAGFADAIHELNKHWWSSAYKDKGNDGFGALTGEDADGDGMPDGVPVRGPDPDGANPRLGELLGYYRTHVETRGTAPNDYQVLVVVACWPSFREPQYVVSAEAKVSAGTESVVRRLTDRNSFFMNVDDGTDVDFKISDKADAGADVTMTAPDNDVPAVNITAPAVYEYFLSDVAPELAALSGGDAAGTGDNAVGADTVTNQDAGILNEETIQAVRDGLNTYVTNNLAGATPITGTGVYLNGPSRIYKIATDVNLGSGGAIVGEGTLIITRKLALAKEAVFDWTGDIIVVEDSNAVLEFKKEAVASIDGVVSIISSDADAKLKLAKDTVFTVDGAVLLVAGTDEKAKLTMKKELDITVNGIFTIVGSEVEVKMDKGDGDALKSFEVNGSFGVIVPSGSEGSKVKFEFKKNSDAAFSFDNGNFESALGDLETFFGTGPGGAGGQVPTTMTLTTYWEGNAQLVKDAQDALLSAAPPAGGWGTR